MTISSIFCIDMAQPLSAEIYELWVDFYAEEAYAFLLGYHALGAGAGEGD